MATIRIVTPQSISDEELEGQGPAIPEPTTPPTADEVVALENYVLYFHHQRANEPEDDEEDFPGGSSIPHRGSIRPLKLNPRHGRPFEELKGHGTDKGYGNQKIERRPRVGQRPEPVSPSPMISSTSSGLAARQRFRKSFAPTSEQTAIQRRVPQLPGEAAPASRKENVARFLRNRTSLESPQLGPGQEKVGDSEARQAICFTPPPLAPTTGFSRDQNRSQRYSGTFMEKGKSSKIAETAKTAVASKKTGSETRNGLVKSPQPEPNPRKSDKVHPTVRVVPQPLAATTTTGFSQAQNKNQGNDGRSDVEKDKSHEAAEATENLGNEKNSVKPPQPNSEESDMAHPTVRVASQPSAGMRFTRVQNKNQEKGSAVGKDKSHEIAETRKDAKNVKNPVNDVKAPQANPGKYDMAQAHSTVRVATQTSAGKRFSWTQRKNQGNGSTTEEGKPHEAAETARVAKSTMNFGSNRNLVKPPQPNPEKSNMAHSTARVAAQPSAGKRFSWTQRKNQGNGSNMEEGKPNETAETAKNAKKFGSNRNLVKPPQPNPESTDMAPPTVRVATQRLTRKRFSWNQSKNQGNESTTGNGKPHETAETVKNSKSAKNLWNENNLEKTNSRELPRSHSTVRWVPRSLSNMSLDFSWKPNFKNNGEEESYAQKLLKRRFKVTPKKPENPEDAPPRLVLKMKSVVLKGLSSVNSRSTSDSKSHKAKVWQSQKESKNTKDTV